MTAESAALSSLGSDAIATRSVQVEGDRGVNLNLDENARG